ncbi:hypothetical protein [Acidihalobacter ferrooxydans]|uniref:Uncharacterized protein n=1 Tax=Acidihalobacter ferrooxydans TaxID=1765967 RepID=A0A1P8UK54_9GAMM|nr:hypothetical protein [Acidihalobacter ferrooxydans]APZ44213.1 hypothetical protein BW247_14880 [Acidihalobacter ferrooxydans]
MPDTGSTHLVTLLRGTSALWPSREYDRQLAKLRSAIGTHIYLVEMRVDDLHVSARFPGKSHELLAIVDFPKPDPARRLYPHLVLLDDGRGINLGRILRISRQRPYAPSAGDLLYDDNTLSDALLHGERALSKARIRLIARRQLAEHVNTGHMPRLDATDEDDDPTQSAR